MKSWQQAKDEIEQTIDRIWMEEPEDITLMRWGVTRSGAGTGGQYFTCLVLTHTYTLMLGQRLLTALMLMATKPELDAGRMKIITKAAISESFHPTLFLADLGLPQMNVVGETYLEGLEDVKTTEDYLALTGAFCTYCNRMHRWVHAVFPWNLGLGAFPQRRPDQLAAVAALARRLDGTGA